MDIYNFDCFCYLFFWLIFIEKVLFLFFLNYLIVVGGFFCFDIYVEELDFVLVLW